MRTILNRVVLGDDIADSAGEDDDEDSYEDVYEDETEDSHDFIAWNQLLLRII